jgi:hypothetical protein
MSENTGRQSRQGTPRDIGDATLRGLVGAGRSRLTPTVAMRARDVAQPDEADLAAAERELVIRRARPRPAHATEPKRFRRGQRGRTDGDPGTSASGGAQDSAADGVDIDRDRS